MSDLTPPIAVPPPAYRPIEVFIARQRRPRYWLHILLLLATMFTTLVVGAHLEQNFLTNQPAFSLDDDANVPFFHLHWILEQPSRLWLGIPFAGPLMLILFSHEMGHYLLCRRYGVQATLPFFIPAPTLIGTLGAVIRVRPPFRSRAVLFDIGIAGPIAGFVVALVALFAGLALSKPVPVASAPSAVLFGCPLICHLMKGILVLVSPQSAASLSLNAMYLHPTAVAALIGMFATAINLIPGGQLDGGHIVFAVSPRGHRTISRLTIGILVLLGFPGAGYIPPSPLFSWVGWMVWAVLLAFTGMRHPPVPLWPDLDRNRRLLALFALAMLALTFTPAPFLGPAMNLRGR